MKYKIEIKNDTVKLNFVDGDFTYRCKLHLDKKYGEVELWDEANRGYKLTIYRHINDMIFCVMDTVDGDHYNERASYWHSYGNLFDTNSFSLEEKVRETIDVLKQVCQDQYELFTSK